MHNSLHYNEIAEALALVCKGTALLTEDTDGTDTVMVSSSCLFSADDNVKLYIDDQNFVKKTVSEVVGLTQVRFHKRVLGDFFTVAAGAQLRLPRDVVPQAKQVLIGPFEPLLDAACENLPAIIIEPETLKQESPGLHGALTQTYGLEVYYLADYPDGLGDHRAVTAEPTKLFDIIMADPYLGGTCYTSRVTEFQYWYDTQYEPTTGEQTVWISCAEVMAKRAHQWEQP